MWVAWFCWRGLLHKKLRWHYAESYGSLEKIWCYTELKVRIKKKGQVTINTRNRKKKRQNSGPIGNVTGPNWQESTLNKSRWQHFDRSTSVGNNFIKTRYDEEAAGLFVYPKHSTQLWSPSWMKPCGYKSYRARKKLPLGCLDHSKDSLT